MRNKWYIVVFVWLCGAEAFGQSPWIPTPKQWIVTPSITYQNYNKFWMGKQKVSTPFADEVNQLNFLVSVEYGLMEDIALDFTSGYTWAEAEGSTLNDIDGVADTLLGVRWTFLDEFKTECPYAPTLTLRLGGIIEGSYDKSFPHSPGDGASGGDLSLLFGKSFGDTGFGTYGNIGYRIRTDHVPDDFFSAVGFYKTFCDSITASVGYRMTQGLSGLDIAGPGFTPDRFPETKEINHNVEFGLSYLDKGGRLYSFLYARTLDGRNTSEKDVFSFAVSFYFD